MSDLDPDKSTPQKTATCPQCGKPLPQSSVIGSLTAFLFQGSNCSCDKSSQAHNARGAQAASIGGYSDFCPRCGLARKGQSQPGSLTGYLFQDTKCRCADNENFDPVSMSQRFWKLKKEENPSFNSGATGGRPDSSGLVYVDLAEGAIIARAYQIVKLIGRGGMGEVYLAKHLTLGKPCALKVIPPGKVDEMGWQRFQAEARLLAKLEHLNLVHVVDLGIHEGCLPFYAMDFIDGLTLADMLAQNGPLSVKLATEIFMQVCDGVDFAHRNGIIHRDLKPANIMIVRSQSQAQPKAQAEKITVKILDFGLAKLTQHDRSKQSLTAVGEIFGSPFYMSPEQCSGGKIDNRSDIYSVGCALFESLTERPPFYGNQAAAIMNGHQFGDPPMLASVVGTNVFPDGLEVVVAKLLRKNPAERYQTMAELKGDLERVARGENVQPYYVSRAKGTAQKNRSLARG
jgi:serine/threonine protein kinase